MQLKKMEEEQLISRKLYAEIPPRTEYELTATGKKLIPILDELEIWGKEHKKLKNEL
ncbi:DNA-binding HxlR family transcriptional regulator [Chryseobacterium camelliae]|nr:DNA-binding HxlR family transcriptional regulator [Chryseobacterium camelliae]